MPGIGFPTRDRLPGLGVGALVLILVGTSAYSLTGLSRERRHTEDLTATNQALTASLRQMQSQLQSVSEKLNALATQPPPVPAEQMVVPVRPRPRITAAPRTRPRVVEDPRWKQMQVKLDDQQKQIEAAREETSQARKDLESSLSSTRSDLEGSIARTHDDVALLQKRGERNYYEFQLDKSKQFQTVGPFRISLRKVNPKQAYYDMVMVVDDRQMQKKHVNLYEPLMFTLSDRPQPVELVVNEIGKNQVKGYISEPKYKKSELAVSTAPAATTPAAADTKTLQRR